MAHRGLELYLIQFLDEKVTVLSVHNSLNRCAEHLYPILLEYALLIEFRTTVECCLAAKGKQYAVWAFLLDNLSHKMRGYRLKVNLVGYTL